MMLRLATDACASATWLDAVEVYRHNVDNSGNGASWGCHELYDPNAAPEALKAVILPHLASRIVYAGAGGFDALAPGILFVTSPRAMLLTHDTSPTATERRGMVIANREHPDADHLRVISAERVHATRPSVLTVGSTLVLLLLARLGIRPRTSLALTTPVNALKRFALDPNGDQRVRLIDGSRLSALELQDRLCGFAERHRRDRRLPRWTPRLVRLWRRTLDRLIGASGDTTLEPEWRHKRGMFTRWSRRRGFEPGRIAAWNRALAMFADDLAPAGQPVGPIELDRILAGIGDGRRRDSGLAAHLRHLGLDQDELPAFRDLRTELLVLDSLLCRLGGPAHH